ncbi:MAG: hypothetical protein ABI818_04000 [Acidobacteriota bacterium]
MLAVCGAFYTVFIARCLFLVNGTLYTTLFDDAMISMRYGRNLAEGAGLVWNPGQAAVQGFTNPAWTLIMAGVHAAGVPPRLASLVMMVLGAVLLLWATAETFRLAVLITEDDDVAVVAAASTGTAYALVFWTLRGMEVGLVAALIAVAASRSIAYTRHARPADLFAGAAALVAAMWTRTDALVPAVVLLAFVVWASPRSRPASLTVACLSLTLGVGAPLVFSRWYYGDALPNTYYLKLGGVSLRDRIGRGLPALFVLGIRGLAASLLPAAALFASATRARQRLVRELALMAALVAAQCAYSVSVGGDAWEWMGYANRYIAIAIPPLAVLAAAGIGALLRLPHARSWATAGALTLLVLQIALTLYLLRSNRAIDADAVRLYQRHAAWMVGGLTGAGLIVAAAATIAARRRSVVLLGAIVWLLANGAPMSRWAAQNAFAAADDERAVRTGLLIRDTLAPDATFAVSSAGSTPYFAARTTVDLLGKSDPVIARIAPVIAEFVPGHNKWDLRYSIGQWRPDLACNLPRRPGETAYLEAQGYHPVGGTCFVRTGARLDERRLAAGLAALYP